MQPRQQAVLDQGELAGDWWPAGWLLVCQASVIEADGSRRDYYPFGAKPLAPVVALA